MKSSLQKIIKALLVAFILFLVFTFILAIAVRLSPGLQRKVGQWWINYQIYSRQRAIQLDYELAKNDTFGGETPEETLRLFIEEVQNSDYKEASKLFVIANQNKWFENLKKMGGKKEVFLSPLVDIINKDAGEYSADGRFFSYYKPVLIRFMRYPSGNWKIVEI